MEARERFSALIDEPVDIECLDMEEKKIVSDGELRNELERLSGAKSAEEFRRLPEKKIRDTIRQLKNGGASRRQIARVTGVSEDVIRGIS